MSHIFIYMDMHKSFFLYFAESKGNIYGLIVSKRKAFYWAGYVKVYMNKGDQSDALATNPSDCLTWCTYSFTKVKATLQAMGGKWMQKI